MSLTKSNVIIDTDMEDCPTNEHLLLFEDLQDGDGLICVAGHKRSNGEYRYFPDDKINHSSNIVGWAYPPTIE